METMATLPVGTPADTVLHYAADGSSKKVDDLGMRMMQRRVWDVRDAQHILLKSPPASGKSRAAMYVSLDKLAQSAVRKVVIAVPERSIGGSFRDTDLMKGGFFEDWKLDRDFCTVGSETGSKVRELISFLQSPDERTALCTHSTLRFAFAEAGIEAFDDCFLCIDELHHASLADDNRLGTFLRGLMDRGNAHILAMTGSYFRGDGDAILHPKDEARFERVIYTYYEQLNGYEHLKTLRIGFHFYDEGYLGAIGQSLDVRDKTIVHIPHVNSSAATSDKNFQVDSIVSGLGKPMGVDPNTGFELVQTGTRVIRVANLVDDGLGRDKIMTSLRNVAGRDDVDVVIALGMAKEGFDWVWCDHVLTVGYRGSLTEIVQIIGRATRDAPAKTTARFTNLIARPYAKSDTVTRAVNDMLKAISVSLLMEQVMAPRFKFRTREGSDTPDGKPDTTSKGPVTNVGEVEVLGTPAFDPNVVKVIEEDFADIFAGIQSDHRTRIVMLNPDAHHVDVLHDIIVSDHVRRRYPSFEEEQVREATQLYDLRVSLTGPIAQNPDLIQTSGVEPTPPVAGENDQKDNGGGSKTKPPRDDEPELTAGDQFVAGSRRFVNVQDLGVDLVGGRREFADAFEIFSKMLDEDLLRQLHGEIRVMHVPMEKEEAERLYPRVREFVQREGREPNLNSANGREARLAMALAQMRNTARTKRDQHASKQASGAPQ